MLHAQDAVQLPLGMTHIAVRPKTLGKQRRDGAASRAGECQGLTEELEEARKAVAVAERERDEQACRSDDLAAQLADMTAARDALACAAEPRNPPTIATMRTHDIGSRWVTNHLSAAHAAWPSAKPAASLLAARQ